MAAFTSLGPAPAGCIKQGNSIEKLLGPSQSAFFALADPGACPGLSGALPSERKSETVTEFLAGG